MLEAVRESWFCRRRPATDGCRFQSRRGECERDEKHDSCLDFVIRRDSVEESCDWKGEGVVGVRDSPSRRQYPGQIDQGFGRDEGSEAWRARDWERPKSYRAMGLESHPDKTIRPNDGLGSWADDVR